MHVSQSCQIPSHGDRQFSAAFAGKALPASRQCTESTQPDIVGYQGSPLNNYADSLFVGELTRSEMTSLSGHIENTERYSQPVIEVGRGRNKYFQTLYTCSDILRHRPFSSVVFAFLFTKEIFTFFAYTREDVIFFEINEWYKDNFIDVMDAMCYLVSIPLEALAGLPTFQVRAGNEDFKNVVLAQCCDLADPTWKMFAHHNRNFGRSTAVYQTDTLGKRDQIIKFAHLAIQHHKRFEDPAKKFPVPTEVLVMQHLKDVFDGPALPSLQEFKSRFPRLEAWAVVPRRTYAVEQTEKPSTEPERELCAILMSGAGLCIGRKSIKGVLATFEFLIDVFESGYFCLTFVEKIILMARQLMAP